jgi:mono/diheme cytochrome c family protein
MVIRRTFIRIGAGIFIGIALAACAPPHGLPEGPTPIPTLIPVTEALAAIEPTETPSFAIRSYPARPPSAADGQEIYTTNCAECHGQDGTGVVPGARNFMDVDYMRGEMPADFYAAVVEGRGEMPAFKDTLSSDEVWDVVFYIWRLSTTAETIDAGREVYNQNCSACHGEDGSGQLLGSANFTDLRQMDQLAPRDLYLTVTQGRGSMPSWQARLSQDERWAVIDYLRTFSYDPTLPGEVAQAPTKEAHATLPATACAQDLANPFAWDDQAAIQAGQQLFDAQCAVCHGSDASGGLPGTPDFTSAEANEELLADPGGHFCALTEGEGAMPAFGDTLTTEARWQLITFLASVGP